MATDFLFSMGHVRKISSTTEFRELTKKDAATQLSMELDKLLRESALNLTKREEYIHEINGFKQLFSRFLSGSSGPSLVWEKIDPLPNEAVIDYSCLPSVEDENLIQTYLDKLVVVKLNGGLGTSMGCVGPKSLIPVRSELTFLDLTVQNIEHLNKRYKVDVPLVLMNSFNTDEDTQKVIRKYRGFQVKIQTFSQSRYPRLNKETLLPIATSINGDSDAWYPPGHGDFYQSFARSGLLDEFINQGQ